MVARLWVGGEPTARFALVDASSRVKSAILDQLENVVVQLQVRSAA